MRDRHPFLAAAVAVVATSSPALASQQTAQLAPIGAAQQLALPEQVTDEEAEFMPALACVTAYAPPSAGGGQTFQPQTLDAVQDFAGLAPLGQRVLDLSPEEYAIAIEERTMHALSSLDLVEVQVESIGELTCFVFATAEDELAASLAASDLRRLQYGVMVDSNRDGSSDALLLTTPYLEGGVVTSSELELLAGGELWWDDSTLTLCGDAAALGEEPGWIAFTAQAFPEQVLPDVPQQVELLPLLDIASGLQDGTLTVSQSFRQQTSQQTGQQLGQQVSGTGTHYFTCPTGSGRTPTPLPGGGAAGELLMRRQCGPRGYDLWCVSQSVFGTRVFEHPVVDGWVGRCPYSCGINVLFDVDVDGDGYPDEMHHNVTDGPCPGSGTSGVVPETMLRTYTWPTASGPVGGETVTCRRPSYTVGSSPSISCINRTGPYTPFPNVPYPWDVP